MLVPEYFSLGFAFRHSLELCIELLQDRHHSPGLLQFIPNFVLGVDPGYILSFMTMFLKFNFIHYQHTWSALVAGSRISTQFSLQGKYCNISAIQIGAGIFRLYNLIYLRDWMAEGRLAHIWKLIFPKDHEHKEFLHSSPLTLEFMSSDPILLSWQIFTQIREI